MTSNILSPVLSSPLDVFFIPESIAIIGATEAPDSVGRALMANLIRSPFGGVLFPVSKRRSSVHGIRAYPSLAALPEPADLAIIATPAPTVPDVLAECLAAGVKGAIVLSAGFADSGPAGSALEKLAREVLRGGSMRVQGSNSLGIACPHAGLNATFAPGMVPAGKVGFLSQSGALLTALLSQEHSARVGCSAFVSVGSLLDISWAEWIDYLACNSRTECLAIYAEHIDDARSFFAAAREIAPFKPVILIKGCEGLGHDPEEDEVFDEACRRSAVLRVHKLADLFRTAALLTGPARAKGRRLAIVSNARGPALLAAAALRAGEGHPVAPAPETVAALGEVLPPRWDRRHPIDVGDDADTERFVRAARETVRDPNADALLALLAPGATIDPVRTAEGLGRIAQATDKPVLACWLWGAACPESQTVLCDAGVPTFHSPEAAVRIFGHLWRHAENVHLLAEIDEAVTDAEKEARADDAAAGIRAAARTSGRTFLTAAEGRQLLSAYGLPVLETRNATNAAEAVEAAGALGYPVLLQLGNDLLFREEGETVQLRADDDAGVRRAVRTLRRVAQDHFRIDAEVEVTVRPLIPPTAVELAVSCKTAQNLGPVIRLGVAGGREGPRHSAPVFAPLTPLTARKMILQTAMVPSLRGRPQDEIFEADGVEQFLLRLSRLVMEQPWIKEITINPLLVWNGRVMAQKVRVALHAESGE